MSDDSISRNALLEKKFDICTDGKCAEVIYAADVMYAPAVDAERHGEWSEIRIGFVPVGYRCSECYKRSDAETPYCPNCGAKMDGDKHE